MTTPKKIDLATLRKVQAGASQTVNHPTLVPTAEAKDRKKSGRPKKDDKEKNTQRIVLLLTEEETVSLQNVSENLGLTTSGYLRFLLKQQNVI